MFYEDDLTVDHIIPRSFCDTYLKGSAVREAYFNRTKVCFSCNRDKSNELWIPNFYGNGWMRYLDTLFIKEHARIFAQVILARHEYVAWWIFLKNIRTKNKNISWDVAKCYIEKDLYNFARIYNDKCKYNDWNLIGSL